MIVISQVLGRHLLYKQEVVENNAGLTNILDQTSTVSYSRMTDRSDKHSPKSEFLPPLVLSTYDKASTCPPALKLAFTLLSCPHSPVVTIPSHVCICGDARCFHPNQYSGPVHDRRRWGRPEEAPRPNQIQSQAPLY